MAPTGGPGGGGGGNIKVVVRVRPFNNRELERNAKCIVQMKDKQTILRPPPEAEERLRKGGKGIVDGQKTFKYDQSYWSFNRSDSHFAGQDNLFNDLGVPLLDNAFQGYNNCIFAYGQTGSGKSYSMMGYGEEAGVIPRICRDMFIRISSLQSDPNLTITVEVSYLEIYNERVRDLLNPTTKGNLRVREHPSTGPYVEDLAKLAVRSFNEIENLMDEGNKARTVAATNMNETSSRSHAVFTLTLTQKRHDIETNMDTEKVAKISLVDLAGSERATATGATGARLKEGAEINRSLSTLGRVIATLADLSSGKKGMKVPYRDSVLTWLLKDSLGGNSMTAMIAAISPADINFEETLSTLRYADSAKRIKNHAVVNEDPNARMIRELKEELAQLRSKLGSAGTGLGAESYPPGTPLDQQFVTITQADGTVKKVSKAEIMEQLSQSEKLYNDLNQTWEEKLLNTEQIHREREAALEELGISIEKGNVGLSTPKKMPHLVNLSDDPLLAECLVYNLKPGITTVGNVDSSTTSEIRLNGSKILDQHCKLENVDNVVSIIPSEGAAVMVNGVRVDRTKRLKSGNRIILGDFHIFRFNNPLEAKAERVEKSLLRHSVTANQLNSPTPFRPAHERTNSKSTSEMEYDSSRAESPLSKGPDFDWSYARREAAGALLGSDPKIMQLTDDELDQLFENVQKAREERRGRPESRFLELEEDGDDLSSFLVRDKYLFNGTNETLSSDTAITMPSTPSQGEESVDEPNGTLKAAQLDMQKQLDQQRDRYQEQLKTTEATASNEAQVQEQKAKMEEALALAKKDFEEQLRRQKEDFEEQMKQLTPQRPNFTLKIGPSGYTELSVPELAIARHVFEKWQQRNYIRIAESILQFAGLVKEAQVMSQIMDKNASFQFVVLDAGQERASSYDLILNDISSDDDALAEAKKPCLGVRVIDVKSSVIHIWSLDKLRQRVLKMRQMHQYIDRPEYRQHFRLENPFSEQHGPLYSFIGDGSLPLTAVFETRVQDYKVDIISPYTQNPIGKIRLSLEPSLAESPPNKIKFNIVMRDMTGFPEHEGTNVHAQMYVSDESEDGVATTQTMTGFGEGPIRFESIHSLTLSLSNSRTAALKVAIYAEVTSMHLDKLKSWDELREMAEKPSDDERGPRLSESEYSLEERHDVFAKVQILELSESGQYMPVEVVQSDPLDGGMYQLHQGLQRRILVSLTHSLTESLPWDDLRSLRVGEIHQIDSSGKVVDVSSNTPDIKLKLIQEPMIKDNADGTSNITITGQWDSSLHKSLLLDRATSDQCKIRFSLRWDIKSSRLQESMTFSMEQHLQILPRSYSRPQSILKSFWNPTRVKHSTDGVFSIAVRPISAKKVADLWRLDTSRDYINGEELLENWSPRGISLVKDYINTRTKRRQREAIDSLKSSLGSRQLAFPKKFRARTPSPSLPDSRQEEILRKFVILWKRPILDISHSIFNYKQSSDSPSTPPRCDDASSSNSSPTKQPLTKTRYTSVVTHTPKNPVSLKSGYLLMPSDQPHHAHANSSQQMQWKRRFVDLRPPYLHVHSVPDGDAINAINLTHARIDHDPDFRRLLGGNDSNRDGDRDRKSAGLGHVFAVYGEQNTFLFAARNESAKVEWILAVDRSYFAEEVDGTMDEGGLNVA